MEIRKFGGLLALFLAASGCDCNKTSAQIQANHVMVATVLATPELTLRREALAGLPALDASVPALDGGCPFAGGCGLDGGTLALGFDGTQLRVAPQTALFAFFGTREGDGLMTAPAPVEGATVKVDRGDRSWALKSAGAGIHTLSSADDSTVTYDAGATYAFTAASGGQNFVGEVRDAPAVELISQLHPAQAFIDIAAGSDLMLTRPDPEPGQQRLLGFVTVIPISISGHQGNPTFSNIPSTPLGFLKLVAAPSEWRSTLVNIPGSAFPEADRNYLIVLQTARVGFASSSNLFIGSAMIAGAADVGVVKTRR